MFENYLRYLKAKDYTVIALRDLEKYIDVAEAKRIITPDLSKNLKN
jgi:hypothetical protein